ncbi:hypothetical protein ACRAWD_30730 [Caulobacter segnis]
MSNRAGHDTPIWFNEFTAGGGGYYGTPGRSRMWAYFGLIYYTQTILAWTFNSHIGGEEQALFGLVDRDGRPSWQGGRVRQDRPRIPDDERLWAFPATSRRKWP